MYLLLSLWNKWHQERIYANTNHELFFFSLSQFSNFNLSYNPKKCVSVYVCVSSASSVCSTIWIFFKFCTKSRNHNTIWLAEPDFRFWISILILRTLRVENGHFSCISAIISKTSHKIFLNFWYVVVLDVVHLFKKTACPGKFVFRSYDVRKTRKFA